MDYLTTANVLLWVFLTVAFYFVFLSHWLVAASLFPDYVAKCQQQYSRPVVTTLVGLLFTVVPITVGLVIANVAPPALKWVGILIATVPDHRRTVRHRRTGPPRRLRHARAGG